MKNIIAALFIVASAPVAVSQTSVSVNPTPVISFSAENAAFNWVQTTYDFGKIKLNVPVSHEFTFTNTGNIPLVISSVKASCGCTVADYTKDPIPVGGQGFVKATYNAATPGKIAKTVTVNANTEEGVVVLTITGEVVK
jgi:hypothetical protein